MQRVSMIPEIAELVKRDSCSEISKQVQLFKNDDTLYELGNTIPVICLVLNSRRQCVYANDRVLRHLNQNEFKHIYGRRPGELFNCIHVKEGPGGCGTSPYCENCGTFQSIIQAQAGEQSINECRLRAEGNVAEDFRIKASPICRDGKPYVVCAMEDIRHENRRKALEGTFFHDIINTASGVAGLIEVLPMVEGNSEKEELLHLLGKISRRLVEEIHSGRILTQAENGSLEIQRMPHDLKELASDTVEFYSAYMVQGDQKLEMDPRSEKIITQTDCILVHRIISNLVKNALEASENDGKVTVSVKRYGDHGVISVHNQTVMSVSIKEQIFERSFSTKGVGRGVGTHSIKLFAEKYLNGKVWFESEEGMGTTFSVVVPVSN